MAIRKHICLDQALGVLTLGDISHFIPNIKMQLYPMLNISLCSSKFERTFIHFNSLKNFFKFIYLRERNREQGGEEREREAENPKQTPCCQHRA